MAKSGRFRAPSGRLVPDQLKTAPGRLRGSARDALLGLKPAATNTLVSITIRSMSTARTWREFHESSLTAIRAAQDLVIDDDLDMVDDGRPTTEAV